MKKDTGIIDSFVRLFVAVVLVDIAIKNNTPGDTVKVKLNL